jgi:hypothetical protein
MCTRYQSPLRTVRACSSDAEMTHHIANHPKKTRASRLRHFRNSRSDLSFLLLTLPLQAGHEQLFTHTWSRSLKSGQLLTANSVALTSRW